MTSADRLEATVTKLQEAVTFQQRTIDDLNEVIIELRADLDRLQQTTTAQQSRIEWLAANAATDIDPDEKPPHY